MNTTKVDVFIHGVPKGQRLWPESTEQTKRYLNSFYTSLDKNVTEFMKVERVDEYVYYTFVKCNNVSDVDGRSGSYFAETLRMNVYYADIQNIYSILEAAYKKLYVGVCITDDGKNIRYRIPDFNQVSPKLGKHKEILIHTIEDFSVDSDLKLLSTVAKSKGKPRCINLQDCNSSKALQIMKEDGCLLVSPQFESEYCKNLIRQYTGELQSVQQKNEAEIQRQKEEYEMQITSLKKDVKRKEQENLSGKDSLNRQIENLKAENNALNTKLDELYRLFQDVLQSTKDILSKFKVNQHKNTGGEVHEFCLSQHENIKNVGQNKDSKEKIVKKKINPGCIRKLILSLIMIAFLAANTIFVKGAMNKFSNIENFGSMLIRVGNVYVK